MIFPKANKYSDLQIHRGEQILLKKEKTEPSVFQTQEFLTLKKEWDAKLKLSGFNDVEKTKQNINLNTSNASVIDIENVSEYFDRAIHYAHNHKFKKPSHKKIMLLHSQGLSIREISKKVGLAKSYIGRIVSFHGKRIKKGDSAT